MSWIMQIHASSFTWDIWGPFTWCMSNFSLALKHLNNTPCSEYNIFVFDFFNAAYFSMTKFLEDQKENAEDIHAGFIKDAVQILFNLVIETSDEEILKIS
eukprot:CAMPEP_0202966252 /NCGR_PEP_ID=MMETSP1396-20130829/10578_1 /ASSEMBLY_ACC=CAM_ASM_000872 /TAXON_ID= /ORGANISM="Pseudokeronopsis sp., Strain Brazil" /LENGTH=99 /DNA_ID=CAMNT_0049689891 /DNA_START=764 /DNA_END=1063 /DNA_ORIENTATION=+